MKWLHTTHVCFLQFSHPAILLINIYFSIIYFSSLLAALNFHILSRVHALKSPIIRSCFLKSQCFVFYCCTLYISVYHSLLIFLLFHPSTPPGIDFGLFIFTRNIKQEKNWGVLDEKKALCRCYRIKVH